MMSPSRSLGIYSLVTDGDNLIALYRQWSQPPKVVPCGLQDYIIIETQGDEMIQ